MADYIFDKEEHLGGTVQPNYKVFCNWSPKTQITDAYKVTRDVCGHKFSTICGFTFKSNLEAPYFILHPELKLSLQYGISDTTFHPTFQVVYVPKARASHVRNDRGLSGWYLWQHVAADNKQIMSIRDFFAYYGFDVAKFFQSDVFKKYLPIFKKQIQAAYDTTVSDFVKSMGTGTQHGYTQRDCSFFSKCVIDSLEKMDDVLKINWEKPDEMKAKLAYNADDTYSLNTKNVKNLDQVSGVDATGTKIDAAESEDVNLEEDEHSGPIETVRQLKGRLQSYGVGFDWGIFASLDQNNKKTTFKISDMTEKSDDGSLELVLSPVPRETSIANESVTFSEADTNEQKSEKMWNKAKARLQRALAGYNDVAEYCKLIAEAYDHDSSYLPDDDQTMAETKMDIAKATKALDDLRKALHFD